MDSSGWGRRSVYTNSTVYLSSAMNLHHGRRSQVRACGAYWRFRMETCGSVFKLEFISVLRSGSVKNYTGADGVPAGNIVGLAQDREGTIWAATVAGVARLEGNRWREVGRDWSFPGKLASAVFVDGKGTLWVATEDTIVFPHQRPLLRWSWSS